MRSNIYRCSVGKSQLVSDFKMLNNLPVRIGNETGLQVGNVINAWKNDLGEFFIDANFKDNTILENKLFKLVYYDLPIAVLISDKN